MKNIKTFEAFAAEYDAKLNEDVINEAQTIEDKFKEILKKPAFIPHIYKTKKAEFDKLGADAKTNFKYIIQQGMKDALTDEKEKGIFDLFKAAAEGMLQHSKERSVGTVAGGGYGG